jgi:hypothetical protein
MMLETMAHSHVDARFPAHNSPDPGSLKIPKDPESGLPILRGWRPSCGCCIRVLCCFCHKVHSHPAPLEYPPGTYRGSRHSHCDDPLSGGFFILSELEGDGAR